MAEQKFDVIAVGDTTQDIFLKMHDASLQCDLNGQNCKICFDYANKIAVENKTDVPAVGNAANHAIGTARLGLRSSIYTIVGDDDQGHKVVEVFQKNNVATDQVAFDKEHGTNLSMVISYQSERTIFVYHEPRDYQLPKLPPISWMYLTSASGQGVRALHRQTLDYLIANPNVKLAFNPGTHQIRLGREDLQPLLKRTAILFLNREECVTILETEQSEPADLIKGFHKLGVKIMVLTDGPKGAYASDGRKVWRIGIFAGPVVERTGAGDAYGSGFLSAIIKDKSVPEAMLWGSANSTSVVQYVGAREGLLVPESLEQMIAENDRIKPEIYS